MGSDLDQVQSVRICSSTSISFSVFVVFPSFEVDCSGDLGLFLQVSTSISSAWGLFSRFLILVFLFVNGSLCSPSIVSNTLYLLSVYVLVRDVDRGLSFPGVFLKSFLVCDAFDNFSFLVCDVFVVCSVVAEMVCSLVCFFGSSVSLLLVIFELIPGVALFIFLISSISSFISFISLHSTSILLSMTVSYILFCLLVGVDVLVASAYVLFSTVFLASMYDILFVCFSLVTSFSLFQVSQFLLLEPWFPWQFAHLKSFLQSLC